MVKYIKFKTDNIHEILKYFNSVKETAVNNIIEYYKDNTNEIMKFINTFFDDTYMKMLTEFVRRCNINNILIKGTHEYETLSRPFCERFNMAIMCGLYPNYKHVNSFVVNIFPYENNYFGSCDTGEIKKNEKLIFEIAEICDKPDQEKYNIIENINSNICEYKGLQINVAGPLSFANIKEIFNYFIMQCTTTYEATFSYKIPDKIFSNNDVNLITKKLDDEYKELGIKLVNAYIGYSDHYILCEYLITGTEEEIKHKASVIENIQHNLSSYDDIMESKRITLVFKQK